MEQCGNGKKCWDVNPNCEAVKLGDPKLRGSLTCKAYEQKKGCWEMDWASDLMDQSESQKGCWKGFYNVGCPECPVFKYHQKQVESMIDTINKA